MTLAETMRGIAIEAAARQRKKDAQAAEQERAAREERIEAGAQAFFRKRIEYLEDLILKEASSGKFEYRVWTIQRGHTDDHLAEKRGLKAVQKWLEDKGFQTEWRVTDEYVPDYGHTNQVELFARWN